MEVSKPSLAFHAARSDFMGDDDAGVEMGDLGETRDDPRGNRSNRANIAAGLTRKERRDEEVRAAR